MRTSADLACEVFLKAAWMALVTSSLRQDGRVRRVRFLCLLPPVPVVAAREPHHAGHGRHTDGRTLRCRHVHENPPRAIRRPSAPSPRNRL